MRASSASTWTGAATQKPVPSPCGAREIIELFATYTEVSPSGTGVKMIGRGKLPYTRKLDDREAYDAGRFFTMTGRPVPGSLGALADCQAVIDTHYPRLFPPKSKKSSAPKTAKATTAARVEPDDDKLLDRIRASKQGDKFAALFDRGDTSGHKGDDSRADLALCCVLAWWAQKDATRVDRLFRRSKLFRGKWDEPRGEDETYGALTVAEAIGLTEGQYDPRHETHKLIRGFATDARARNVEGEKPTPDEPHNSGAEPADAPEADADQNNPTAPESDCDAPDESKRDPPAKEPDEEKRGKPAAATKLIELAQAAGIVLFHTPDQDAYAQVPAGHLEVHSTKGTQFRRFLTQIYFEAEGKAANGEVMGTAIATLEAIATFTCPEHPVYRRMAPGPDGALVLDLCDDQWRVVVIRPGAWELTDCSPVMFARSNVMRPLPEPARGGRLTDLHRFLNLKSEDDWLLVTAWLSAALRPKGPYPVLHPKGEQGTAKLPRSGRCCVGCSTRTKWTSGPNRRGATWPCPAGTAGRCATTTCRLSRCGCPARCAGSRPGAGSGPAPCTPTTRRRPSTSPARC